MKKTKAVLIGVGLAVVAGLGCDDGGEDPRGGSNADSDGTASSTDDVTGPPPEVIPANDCNGGSESDAPRDACGTTESWGDDTPETTGTPETTDPTDTGMMCYADFPCFGFTGRCDEGGAVAVTMRDGSCTEVCPSNGPCSGGICVEESRVRCEEGTVCVTEELSFDRGTASCQPLDKVCGGPDGIGCGEAEYCAFSRDAYNGSACGILQAKAYGVCKPQGNCEQEGEVCGCRYDGDEFVFETFDSECALQAGGAALNFRQPCEP